MSPGGDPLVHLEVLLGAVERAVCLLPGDGPRGEVPHAVAEANLAQLVVVGQEVLEGADLLLVEGGATAAGGGHGEGNTHAIMSHLKHGK